MPDYDSYFDYTTVQGDTFDAIALDYYDDEHFAHYIIQANPEYSSVLIFDAGIKLKIPIVDEKDVVRAPASLPPWAQS